jgi:hypothetical protein
VQLGDYKRATEYAQAALTSMQAVVGGFHPALGPYFELLALCLTKADMPGEAEKVR